MPFQIVRNDIVNMQVDAIVNTANPQPQVGSGTDRGIHAKAGPGLLEARKAIGRIPRGHAAITPGFDLNAKYVIHTVGPVWRGGLFGEEKTLRGCYASSLALALEHGCRSIAFPLISAGNYGYPKNLALRAAISVFSEFLTEHDMQIYLVVFDRDSFRLSEKLFRDVSSYIDEHYVRRVTQTEYPPLENNGEVTCERRRIAEEYNRFPQEAPVRPERPAQQRFHRAEPRERSCSAGQVLPPQSAKAPDMASRKAVPRPRNLREAILATDAGFSETLLKLIDQSGRKDSEIYNKANISRQHFSKIRNNKDYKPTKPTALAFAIALELDLEQTKDLIGRAGYALTRSSKFDVIIMFFIENRNYNLHEINAALYEFDQSILGV